MLTSSSPRRAPSCCMLVRCRVNSKVRSRSSREHSATSDEECVARFIETERASVALDLDPSRAEGEESVARAIECDVTDRTACEAAIAEVVRDYGTVHTLVNMAQEIISGMSLLDTKDDEMARSFESGPTGTLRMMQLCHPLLKANGGGAIVNFASGAGTDGLPGHGAYAAAKEAIRGLTKVAARRVGSRQHPRQRDLPACLGDPRPDAASDGRDRSPRSCRRSRARHRRSRRLPGRCRQVHHGSHHPSRRRQRRMALTTIERARI